jgi:hypothetical protein
MSTTEEPIVSEEPSAPEADEHAESQGPKLLTKDQVNHRKKMAILVDQAVRHAKRHDIEFISFFEGLKSPMEVKASCTPALVRAVVAHLALVANEDFNKALETLREMFPQQDQPEPEECSDSPATSTQEEQEHSDPLPE